jgi:hypothetical protein
MMLVKFVRHHPPYAINEVAGFSDAHAARMIAAGLAAPLAEPSLAAEPDPADEDTKALEAAPKKARPPSLQWPSIQP